MLCKFLCYGALVRINKNNWAFVWIKFGRPTFPKYFSLGLVKIVGVSLFSLTLSLTNAALIGSFIFSINVVNMSRPWSATRFPQLARGYWSFLNVIHVTIPPVFKEILSVGLYGDSTIRANSQSIYDLTILHHPHILQKDTVTKPILECKRYSSSVHPLVCHALVLHWNKRLNVSPYFLQQMVVPSF